MIYIVKGCVFPGNNYERNWIDISVQHVKRFYCYFAGKRRRLTKCVSNSVTSNRFSFVLFRHTLTVRSYIQTQRCVVWTYVKNTSYAFNIAATGRMPRSYQFCPVLLWYCPFTSIFFNFTLPQDNCCYAFCIRVFGICYLVCMHCLRLLVVSIIRSP